jgi:hypothetical protein
LFDANETDIHDFILPNLFRKRRTPNFTIYLDLNSGSVHILSRWRYHFSLATGQPAWTDAEKSDFHWALKSNVWKDWNSSTPLAPPTSEQDRQFRQLIADPNNVRFAVSGTSNFARAHATTGVDVDFEIISVSNHAHWQVNVRKVAPGAGGRSEVDWNTHHIHLYSVDNDPSAAQQEGPNPASTSTFVTTPHEFGHTLLADDEYTRGSRHRPDVNSIMNIGHEIRPRHLAFIAGQLNHMLPNTRFVATNAPVI